MWPVSDRFLETVQGSHRAVARARICRTPQFGPDPAGDFVPLLSGQVRHLGSSDVKAQLRATLPGEYWDDLQPYGVELFVERGVAFGDGQEEYVPQGYFPVRRASQASQPHGPIDVDCDDRTRRAIDTCRVVYPYQVPTGTSHRQIVDRLINGNPSGAGTYGVYGAQGGPKVPIIWDDAGYDPDVTVGGSVVVEDSGYEFLAKLVATRGATLRFRPTGELEVIASSPAVDAPPVYALRQGRTGTLKRASRSTSDEGVYNIVRATGSDPAVQTGYRLAYITDETSPLRWSGPIGPRVRYYASPLLSTSEEADQAAETVLAKSTGLPTNRSYWTVPNPALRPLDVVSVPTGAGFSTDVLDEVVVPLVGGGETELRTRTLNPLGQVEVDLDPEPTPPPPPPPGPTPDPGGTPGPTPGGGSGADGVQAALLNNWGPIVAGDEFVGNTIDTGKWGLYNSPGHGGNGTRRAAAFSQNNGILTITGDNNNQSGGAAFRYSSYGYRVECRIRVYRDGDSPGRGDRYHPVLILWPSNDDWPGGAEYDFYECDEGDARGAGFMHLPNHTPYRQDHFTFANDNTQFFNMACEWNPRARTLKTWRNGELVYDGRGRVAEAPGPMHLTFQLDHFGGNPRRAKFDMAWARIYARPNG